MPEPTAATEQTTATAAASTATATGTAPATGDATTATASTAQATGDQTTATQATAAAPAAIEYTDFKVPDDYSLEGELGDKFKTIAKELGLNQEQAQKLIDLDVQRANAHVETVHKATAEWLNMAKADKEIGGDALEANVAIAKKALDTFGTDSLKQMLQVSGLGNHPEVIRVFHKIGKAISEDGFVSGDKGNKGSDARNLFPNSNMNP